MEFSLFDEGRIMADRPVAEANSEDHEFRVEVGFHELEIVAFVGQVKIVGRAHFGITGRSSDQRPSDYLRHFADTRLTLSQVRIYRLSTNELLDTASFIILNLERADLVYAREATETTDEEPETPPARAPRKK